MLSRYLCRKDGQIADPATREVPFWEMYKCSRPPRGAIVELPGPLGRDHLGRSRLQQIVLIRPAEGALVLYTFVIRGGGRFQLRLFVLRLAQITLNVVLADFVHNKL